MSTSPVLGLPYIASQQSQPEVTHNAALNMLAVALFGVTQVGLNAAPGSPTEGDSYVVGPAGSGAFSGRNNKLAIYTEAGWVFLPGVDDNGSQIAMGAAQEGLRVWSKADDCGFVWTGSAWVAEGGAMATFTVATVPAATGPKRLIYVSDETGGAIPAFNDGVNWRRVSDRTIVA